MLMLTGGHRQRIFLPGQYLFLICGPVVFFIDKNDTVVLNS